MDTLNQLSLRSLHADHGAKFVPFAGYDMPVQYATGVMANTCTPGKKRDCLMSVTWANCSSRLLQLKALNTLFPLTSLICQWRDSVMAC